MQYEFLAVVGTSCRTVPVPQVLVLGDLHAMALQVTSFYEYDQSTFVREDGRVHVSTLLFSGGPTTVVPGPSSSARVSSEGSFGNGRITI